MAAITDKLLSVGNRGTLTTLAAPGKAIGASSLKIVQPLNWSTDTKVAFSIWTVYQGGANDGKEVAGTYTEWTGILNAVDGSIDSLTLEQGTDQYYAPGAGTRVAIHISVTLWSKLMSALRGFMNLDGSLKKSPLEDALQIKTTEIVVNQVLPGTGIVAVSSGLTCTISDITYYLSGIRYTKTGIPNKTFTANKDTYCFIDTQGNMTYTEVVNNAAIPATPANSILRAAVSTSSSAVTSIAYYSNGSGTSGWQELGVCALTSSVSAGTGAVLVVKVPKKNYYKITARISRDSNVGNSYAQVTINNDNSNNYPNVSVVMDSSVNVIGQAATIGNLAEVRMFEWQTATVTSEITKCGATYYPSFVHSCTSPSYNKQGGGWWLSSAAITSFELRLPSGVGWAAAEIVVMGRD